MNIYERGDILVLYMVRVASKNTCSLKCMFLVDIQTDDSLFRHTPGFGYPGRHSTNVSFINCLLVAVNCLSVVLEVMHLIHRF